MTLTTTNLSGDRVLVRGADSQGFDGEAVLDGTQWREINEHKAYDQAVESFDASVEEFFAPILAAAEEMEKTIAPRKPDAEDYVVLHEPVEAVQGSPGHLIKLTHDSKVLRLLSRGQQDRLVWVGGDKLEILEVDDALPFDVVDDSPVGVEDVELPAEDSTV